MRFVARAPTRVDPAGGGCDAPPYCVEYGGSVVNFSIAVYAYASFERLPPGSGVLIYSHDQQRGVIANSVAELRPDGNLDFLKFFVKRLVSEGTDLLLTTQSDAPERSGLGGSGALGVVTARAITRARDENLSREEIALLANEIEREDFGNKGGNQDSYGAAFGGAKLITYHKGGGSECRILDLPPDLVCRIERDSALIYTGKVHLSGTIHADIKRSYQMENSPTIKAMDNLTDAANKMAVALESGDLPTVTECLNRSRRNHYALHESCDSETLREFFRTLESHILGGKTCGAGGGGFIMVVARPNQRKRCIQLAEQLGGKALNFIFDHRGVVDWCEPSSTPQELQALRDAIESGGPL